MVNLIHMNGRVYDPVLGRFLSADPQIQDPTNSQSLNRYTYCMNNPIAFTDPTGYGVLGDLWHDITHAIHDILSNQYVQMAIGIGLTALAMEFPG
ncbi:MAG: RHS repeat-associated core domain-containing protein, partial [Pseudomonadota bacterium]